MGEEAHRMDCLQTMREKDSTRRTQGLVVARLHCFKIAGVRLDAQTDLDLVTGARITYEQLKGGKTWLDDDSLAREL